MKKFSDLYLSAKVVEACHLVGAAQLLDALLEHGDAAIKKLLVDNPDPYIRILNVVCRLADSGLRYDKKFPVAIHNDRNPNKERLTPHSH